LPISTSICTHAILVLITLVSEAHLIKVDAEP